jgi:hypothetical protein
MALDDQLTPDQLDEMIGEIDTDGSGTVDFEGEQTIQRASLSTALLEDLRTFYTRRVTLLRTVKSIIEVT